MWWQTSNCSSLLIYRPREDERPTWPGWLTYSGRLTHISGYSSATGRAQSFADNLKHILLAILRGLYSVACLWIVVVVVVKFFNKSFVKRKVENTGIQYTHTKINNNINIVESCLYKINTSLLIYITIEEHAVNEVFAHELRPYEREGEAVTTGMEIITSVFGWWKELM